MKKIVLLVLMLVLLSGCSFDRTAEEVTSNVDQKVQQIKEDVSNKVEGYVENTVNQKVDSTVKSLESTVDPKLGEIRNNMGKIKEAAQFYYEINKKMPVQQKIEPLFQKTFKEMQIQYKLSNDSQRAFVTYIGNQYSKDKVGEIVVEPNK